MKHITSICTTCSDSGSTAPAPNTSKHSVSHWAKRKRRQWRPGEGLWNLARLAVTHHLQFGRRQETIKGAQSTGGESMAQLLVSNPLYFVCRRCFLRQDCSAGREALAVSQGCRSTFLPSTFLTACCKDCRINLLSLSEQSPWLDSPDTAEPLFVFISFMLFWYICSLFTQSFSHFFLFILLIPPPVGRLTLCCSQWMTFLCYSVRCLCVPVPVQALEDMDTPPTYPIDPVRRHLLEGSLEQSHLNWQLLQDVHQR